MEAETHNTLSASWRPRNVSGIDSSPNPKPDGQEWWWWKPSPTAWEDWCSSRAVRQKKWISLSFIFVPFIPSVIWMMPIGAGENFVRAICFIQSMDLNANLIWKHTDVPRNNLTNSWVPCDPVKITHKIDHHTPLLHLTEDWKV